MRHKKHKLLHKVHSIPILNNLCKEKSLFSKRLYLVSYSIPLSCMVVLLLGSIVFVNPSLLVNDKSYAVGVGDIDGVSVDDSVSDSLGDGEDINNGELADEEFSGPAEDDPDYALDSYNGDDSVGINDGIMPLASTTIFSIGGAAQNAVVETGVEEVAYRSHTVTVSVSNAEDYYLMISGSPNLSSTGESYLTGVTDGTKGPNIPAGKWGYGWDYTGTTTKDTMTYKSVSKMDTKLTIPALSSNAASFTGSLSFAAKFPLSTTQGNYTSNVSLTLIVTPKGQTSSTAWRDSNGVLTTYDSGTDSMQNIDKVKHEDGSGFCKNNSNVKEGWTVDLVDNRDNKTYTVVKLGDGNCWMGQNMALTGPKILTTNDTDLKAGSADWSLPASETSWSTSDYSYNIAQIRTGSTSLSGWKKGYGNYYSWCAATAETCMSGTTAITSGEAASSICPKGWKLPPNSGNGSYTNLTNAYQSSWLTSQTINGTSGVNGYRFGFNSATVSKGANFWPAAGHIYNTDASIYDPGSGGYYWSRTPDSNMFDACYMNFGSNSAKPARIYHRWYGLSVRCVATY